MQIRIAALFLALLMSFQSGWADPPDAGIPIKTVADDDVFSYKTITTDSKGNYVIEERNTRPIDLTDALKPVQQKQVTGTIDLSEFDLDASDMAEIKAMRERLKGKPKATPQQGLTQQQAQAANDARLKELTLEPARLRLTTRSEQEINTAFSGIDEMLDEIKRKQQPPPEVVEWAKTVEPVTPPFNPLEALGDFYTEVCDRLEEIPATKIFFLTATILLIAFAFPLWKTLNTKKGTP